MNKNTVLKDFSKYVSLNVLGMMGTSIYILADTFFIAKALGANGLTALNFCISIFSILQGIGLMVGIGGATRYSIFKNSGDNENANKTFMHSLILGLSVALIFIIIGLFFATPLLTLLGADTSTLPLAKVYLTTFLAFSPFFIVNNILIAFIRNDSNPRLSMTAMLISSLSNIFLDYLFMFPLSMGMFGAAFATSLSPIISICVLSSHFWRRKSTFTLLKCRIIPKKIIDIITLGLSAFISELSSAIVLITFNLIILSIEGNIGVAAYGIIANIALIAIAIFTGVAQGIQPLASRGFGTRDLELIKKVLRYGLITTILIAFVIYGIIYLFTVPIVSAFNSEANIALTNLATSGMQIYFIGFFFAGINIIVATYFSAITNAKEALIISLLRSSVLLIPMVIVLSSQFEMNGVWLSFVLTELIVSILSVVLLIKKARPSDK